MLTENEKRRLSETRDRCACGARRWPVAIQQIAGPVRELSVLVDPCLCPRPYCISCRSQLEDSGEHPVCQSEECSLFGLWQIVPDMLAPYEAERLP